MQENIQEIVELNKVLDKKIQETISPVSESLLETEEFKHTSKALLSFIPKSSYLNSSILNSSTNKNVYSAGILFRSMIEHNFRHLYIFTRALNEDSDSVDNEYYNALRANEDLESFSKINNYNKIVGSETTEWSTKGSHNKQIREKAKNFRIEQIFYYLIENGSSEESEAVERFKKEYSKDRLVDYTKLSSGVHGGPYAESILNKQHESEESLEDDLHWFAKESFELHKSLVGSTYLFASLMDDDLQNYYEEIRGIDEK